MDKNRAKSIPRAISESRFPARFRNRDSPSDSESRVTEQSANDVPKAILQRVAEMDFFSGSRYRAILLIEMKYAKRVGPKQFHNRAAPCNFTKI